MKTFYVVYLGDDSMYGDKPFLGGFHVQAETLKIAKNIVEHMSASRWGTMLGTYMIFDQKPLVVETDYEDFDSTEPKR